MEALSRSMVVAAVFIVAGIATFFGVDFSEDQKALLLNHLNGIVASVSVVFGLIVGVLRAITTSPLVGLFKKEKVDASGPQ